MTPVGLTSRWTAASRALESQRADRLFADPHARALAGEEGFSLLAQADRFRPAAPTGDPDPYLAIRTRFFDDALRDAARGIPGPQVVLLAAGMDSRAFRLDWPDGTVLYEVDRPEVFDCKEAILRDRGAEPECDRRIVPADLRHDWTGALLAAGFQADRPGAFLVEGLLVYLEEPAVVELLATLAGVGCSGSWLGADVVDRSLLESPFLTAHLEHLNALGCPWRFGTAEPEQFFGRQGWAATVVQPGEPGAHYGRWPWPVGPRNLPGIPRSYFVTARRE